jgi:hypothetical protein
MQPITSRPEVHESGAQPTAAPDPELVRLRRQLDDCVTCPSAQTPEGRANITRLRAQIDALTAGMAPAVVAASASTLAQAAQAQATAPRPSIVAAVGGYLDLQA